MTTGRGLRAAALFRAVVQSQAIAPTGCGLRVALADASAGAFLLKKLADYH